MRRKKVLITAFGTMGLTAILAASAFACTVFRGTLTLQGNRSATTVKTTGLATGMSQTVSNGVAKASKSGGSIKLWAGKDQYGRALPAKTYLVRYYNSTSSAPGYSTHYRWQTDCMTGGPGRQIGTATVNSTGAFNGGALTFSLGNSARTDSGGQESAVCVSDSGAAFGNMAPVAIVL